MARRLSQAIINSVKRRTQLDHYAPHQFRLRYYDTAARAWREGQIVTREAALRGQFEARVSMALTMLGFDPVHAEMIANSASYNVRPLDWRQCVREELKINTKQKVVCDVQRL